MFRTAVFRAVEAMEGEEEDEGMEEVGISEPEVLEVAEGGGVVVGGEEEEGGEEVIQATFHKEAITSYSPNGAASILQPLSSSMPNNDNNSGYLTHYQPSPRPLPTMYFLPNSPSSLSLRTPF